SHGRSRAAAGAGEARGEAFVLAGPLPNVAPVGARVLAPGGQEARDGLEDLVPGGQVGADLHRRRRRIVHTEKLADQPPQRPLVGFVAVRAGVTDGDRTIDFDVPFEEALDLVRLVARVAVGKHQDFVALDWIAILLAL